MDAFIDERIAWEKELARGGWTCIGWPKEHGGRGATLYQEVIFAEEYARARAPGRAGHIGEGLLGPTVLHFGTDAQKQRFLPPIVAGEEMWFGREHLPRVQWLLERRQGAPPEVANRGFGG